jgi:2-oxoglutarate ferredoxin oxidoreductase subunit gamma
VIISETDIFELEPSKHDVLVAMAQPGYEKFVNDLKPGGILITDKDLVTVDPNLNPPGVREHAISATDIAFREFGRRIIANMVILGYMNCLLQLVTTDALEKAISESVPKGTEELNLNAMRKGMALARQEHRSD